MYSNYLSINQNIVNKNTPTYTDIKRQVTISKQVTVTRQVIRPIKHMRANPHLRQRDGNQNTLTDPNLAHEEDKFKKMESGKQRLPKGDKRKTGQKRPQQPGKPTRQTERRQNDWNFTIFGKGSSFRKPVSTLTVAGRERESVPSELPCNGAEGESGMGTVSLIQGMGVGNAWVLRVPQSNPECCY